MSISQKEFYRHGIHNLQDPEQTIFFKNSNDALTALLAGQVDVGCAATGTLEKYIHPETGEPLDMSQIRILNPQNHSIDGVAFPFKISSDLVPGYLFSAFPHVELMVKFRVQQELLALRDHADVAPALLACLEDRGCFRNNTDCAQSCFESLSVGTIRNCDTTPERALNAFDALGSRLVAFTEPLQNLRLRDIQETTGFLIKEGGPRCVRLENIVDATTCPSGHFARSSLEIVQQCNVSGLPCYDMDCFCSPCVKAFEVDFFPVADTDNDDNMSSAVGSGCSKFSLCGKVQQEHALTFRAIDNRERPNATMTGAFLLPDESEDPFTFEKVGDHPPTFQFDFVASKKTVGQKAVKIRINDEEIPESPFRIHVLKRDCAADTGDPRREADDFGQCVCQRGMVEISSKCVSLAVLIPCTLAAIIVVFSIGVHFYVKYKKEQADNFWKIKPNELHFENPPRVLGRGTFGLVVLAEYRGTAVAVKQVCSPNMDTKSAALIPSSVQLKKTSISSVESPSGNAANDTGGKPNGMSSGISSGSIGSRSLEELIGVKNRRIFPLRRAARMRENFIEEIRLLSKLRHPNITTVMGAVVTRQYEPLLVMECMYFGSLHDLLHNKSVFLEDHVLFGVLHDVACGLHFLHSSDPIVLHGDLKTQNVLVVSTETLSFFLASSFLIFYSQIQDDKFRAKITDFGCGAFHTSRSGSLRKQRSATRGSPYFMAPELLNGESKNTKETVSL